MAANVGNADKAIRVILAVVAVILALVAGASSPLGIILFVVAAILLVTALAGFCPLYRLVGVNTCPAKRA
jgi:hypothetical protein